MTDDARILPGEANADQPHVQRWTAKVVTTLGVAFGVLLVVYELLGWPRTHVVIGAALAGSALAGIPALTDRLRGKLHVAGMNAVGGTVVLVGVVILPTMLHVGLDAAAQADPVGWPHGGLFDVPRLADEEPVRGTGCGAHTQTTTVSGTHIPDGTWFGAVRGADESTLSFDLICAYSSEKEARLNPSYSELDARRAIVRHPAVDPTWLTLNANTKVRRVPMGPNFRYHEGQWSASGRCQDDRRSVPLATDVEVWLVIDDGVAVLAVRVCDLALAPA